LRMFTMKGSGYTKRHKLSSLKILGTVGEPIDESTWKWFFKNIGKNNCPIIDTYWQTETGATVIESLPGHGPFIPSYAGKPFPGIEFEVLKGVSPPLAGRLLRILEPAMNFFDDLRVG